ncbi:MAG: hypothetical protein ACE366_25775 [Bradymonadia bacterium]
MRYTKLLFVTACALGLSASVAAAQTTDPVIKLIDAGKGEKKTLRFAVKKGDKQSMDMVMKMGMETQVGPNKMPKMDLPGIKMTMSMEVLDVAAETFDYQFKLTAAEPMKSSGPMADMMIEAMKKPLANLVGLGGKGKMTNRGINKGMDLQLPSTLDAQTKQMLDGMQDAMSRMSAPVPAEPIGVGGKWSVEQTIAQNGITVQQKTTYTVKKFEGQKVVLGVAVDMNAPKQEMKAPGMPPNVKVMLDKMGGSGEGETTLVMTQVLPSTATANINTDMKANMNMGGQQQPMNMKMSMKVDLNSGTPAP